MSVLQSSDLKAKRETTSSLLYNVKRAMDVVESATLDAHTTYIAYRQFGDGRPYEEKTQEAQPV
jgi:hypothetical protein